MEKKKKTVKGPQKPMAVLSPTPHQEKEHQQKSREDKRNKSGDMCGRGSFPCAVCSEGQGGKGSFLPEKEWKEMGR